MKIQERFVKACIEGDDEEARDLFFANWDEIDVNEVDDVSSIHFCQLSQLFTIICFGYE